MIVTDTVLQVTGQDFTAQVVIRGEKCIAADPRLGWCKGRSRVTLRQTFQSNEWGCVVVSETKGRVWP